MRVIVLGGGIVGMMSAFWLHKAGHEVELVERCEGAGLETSWGNGAIVHASSVEPWAAPGMPWKILTWLGKTDAPMLLRPAAVPKLWRWGIEFLRACTHQQYRAATAANVALALESLAGLAAIRAETGIEYDLTERAVLKIYRDPASLAAGEAQHLWLRDHGITVERLTPQAAIDLEPALRHLSNQLVGALFFPQDELGDCHKMASGVATWLAARGVSFHFGTAVEGLEVQGGRATAAITTKGRLAADAIVVALGPWTPVLLRQVGLRVPIYPVKGISLTAPRSLWPEAPRHAILDDDGHYGLVPIGDRLRLAGSAEITGWDTTPDPIRVEAVVKHVVRTFPAYRQVADSPEARPWAGLRPVTPTDIPIIGPTAIQGLYINSGHGHAGWTLSAGSGMRLAKAVGTA